MILYAAKSRLTLREREVLASGAANVYPVQFEFSEDWDGLTKTAVFKAGELSVSVLLDSANGCIVPWEVLRTPGRVLFAGVYGTVGGDTVLPTIWAGLGTVLEGAVPGEETQPPTPDLWRQELDQKADGLDYDGAALSLLAGKKPVASVPIASGVSDHRLLAGRDTEEQHPISAITGLEDEIRRIPAPVEPLKNLELEELLT